MNHKTLILLFFFTTGLFLSAWPCLSPAEENIQWKRISNPGESVQVYTGRVKDSDFLALRGETRLNFSMDRVARVLLDVPHKTEWIKSLIKAKIVRNLSKTEFIEYSLFDAPWPIKDRDFVFKTSFFKNTKGQIHKINMESVTDPLMPELQNTIRGQVKTSFLLRYLDAQQTEMRVEIQADPKGSLPVWLVNMIQKKWPVNTVQSLINQLQKTNR